jgi:hypothetical protein
MPKKWLASSIRSISIQNRPAVYAITYSANARPRPNLYFRSSSQTSTATPMSHSAS